MSLLLFKIKFYNTYLYRFLAFSLIFAFVVKYSIYDVKSESCIEKSTMIFLQNTGGREML